jgi:ribonuclease HII
MPDLQWEKAHMANHAGLVVGIDEAGRGPWAGPVTAAAAWLSPNHFDCLPDGLDDSKKLSRIKRKRIFADLQSSPHEFVVVSAPVSMIDEIGILKATFWAMREAAQSLQAKLTSLGCGHVDLCLVDGNLTPDLGLPARAIVKGDMLSCSIAAASVIAKETRDHLMVELAGAQDIYGWQRNMGYGTRDHAAALQANGVSPHHRRSFAPIKKLLQG